MKALLLFVFVATALCKCGVGISGCSGNNCCSYWGYCGSTNDYCGTGATQCVCDCHGSKPCISTSPTPAATTTTTTTSSAKASVTIQSFARYWLGTITDNKNYSGLMGIPVTRFRAKVSTGTITYKVHFRNGGWSGEFKNWAEVSHKSGYPIDALMMKYSGNTKQKLHYQVHTRYNKWWGDVTGYSTSDSYNGYAGVLGQEIDGIRVWFTDNSGSSTGGTTVDVPTNGLAFKASDFYVKVNFSKRGSAVTYIDGVALYDQIPWADDGKWYRLDYDKCKAYIKKVMNCDLKVGTINSDSAAGNVGSKTIDGIAAHHMSFSPLMAWLDGRADGKTDSSTGWSASRAAKYHGVAVFEKSGKLYYWPVTSGDNMGHCWPGGVAQTMIPGNSALNTSTGKVTMNLWDVDWDGKKNQPVTVDYKKDILSGDVYTKHLGYSKWRPPAYAATAPDYHCEMHANAKKGFDNGGYKFKYFIMHKE